MRTRRVCIACVLLGLCLSVLAAEASQRSDRPTDAATVRFDSIEVWIETGDAPLAAYQIEIEATTDNVTIVGIEGGAHPQFSDPPYYDNRAMQNDRVIVADFSTAAPRELPTGRTRIVTLHVQITGTDAVQWNSELQAAADVDGNAIPATIELVKDGQT